MNVDPRTLLIIGGFGSWVLAAVIEFQAMRPGGGRRLPDPWTLGLLAQGLGLNLISQRGMIPDLWSISLANALLMSTPLFSYVALQRIRGAQANRLLVAAVPVAVGILLPIIGFSDEAFPERAIVVLCAALFGLGLNLWAAAQIARTGRVAGASMIILSAVLLIVTFIAFVVSVASKDVEGVFSGTGIQVAFYAVNDLCILLSTLGYMELARIARNELEQFEDPLRPDRLTGLYSRAAFMRSGREELQRSLRRGYPVCALLVSIDGLERIAAVRGEDFANAALKRVADIVLSDIRSYDLAGRISQHAIAILLPELGIAAGREAAGRIRARVEADPAPVPGAPDVRISVGLCEAPATEGDLDAVLATAEDCLERALNEGGNRVATP